jgi:hypothetical protein
MKTKDFFFLSSVIMLPISCSLGVYDRVNPPEIYIKTMHIYETEGPSFWVFKNDPNEIFIRNGNNCKKFNITTWGESDLPGTFVYENRSPEVEPVEIAYDHSIETSNWKAEFVGKFRNQDRTFNKGQGIIPTGSVTKTFKVFSGDIYFSVGAIKIFKQHVENYADKIRFITYPDIGLIIVRYTNIGIYPKELIYLIKISPFPSHALAPIATPENIGGVVGHHNN